MSDSLPRFCPFFILGFVAPLCGVEITYNQDIRPILAEHCFACHGRDEEAREAELRLDQRAVAIDKQAIVPEQPSQSELVRRILSDDPDEAMPPADQSPLTARQKDLLQQWIKEGAEYESHWAFVAPRRPSVPADFGDYATWPRNSIDGFILRRLLAAGLTPSLEASRYALIRRLYLDLIGLPPTPPEVDAFVRDDSAEAYEKVVDRLLASDHFGEHWARMWLDLARYADTKGYEKDNHREIWRYRDWVINAFNADMPYSQFTMEQLAGDLLPEATTEQLLATAFHRNTMTNDEGGTDNEEFRTIAVKDRVDTTMQVWMGLTMGCAKCHSHKYDPISQQEYYQFYAWFNQTADADRSDEAPKLSTPTTEQAKRLAELKQGIAATKKKKEELGEDDPLAAELTERLEEMNKELSATQKAIVTTPIMRELAESERRATHLHIRGNFLDQGEQVSPGMPAAFGSFAADVPLDRRAVAQWLLQDANPLTARVAVNRVWARIFGIGLVETEEDFGTQGASPSHPDLLDWLAIEFRDSLGWSHKQLCKLIVMSATYRQSSVVSDLARDKDPQNRLLSRASRFRLSAETVRDQALAATGLLTRRIGGPSVMPPQPEGIWKATYSTLKWTTATDEQRYRRGLYTYWRRTSPHPSMMTFDAGSREVCLIRRVRTNIPLQALVTLNDPVFVEASGALAKDVLAAEMSTDAERMTYAFQRVLVRLPADAEAKRLRVILDEALAAFENDNDSAMDLLGSSRVAAENQETATLAAWTIVANVLLNLDETLMRN